MNTAMHGYFQDGKMVEAVAVDIKEVYLEKSRAILRVNFNKPQYCPQGDQIWL